MFFIEIVSRLQNEWKVKWKSLGTFSNSGFSLARYHLPFLIGQWNKTDLIGWIWKTGQEGMFDEGTNNRIQNGDLEDYQYASPLKITPGQGSTEPLRPSRSIRDQDIHIRIDRIENRTVWEPFWWSIDPFQTLTQFSTSLLLKQILIQTLTDW